MSAFALRGTHGPRLRLAPWYPLSRRWNPPWVNGARWWGLARREALAARRRRQAVAGRVCDRARQLQRVALPAGEAPRRAERQVATVLALRDPHADAALVRPYELDARRRETRDGLAERHRHRGLPGPDARQLGL